MKKISSSIVLFLYLSINAFGQDSLFTSVFSTSGLAANTDSFSFTHTFSPTSSYFQVLDYFPETSVFQAQLSYSGPTPAQSYEMRIGKGGQIYFFRSAFGESVPPNYRSPTRFVDGVHFAPFVDDVWQMVAVDGSLNDRDNDNKYFIHQAGVYIRRPEQTQPFYSPLVSEYYSNGSYTTVNWGQQAHTDDNYDVKFSAYLMYYTRYTNIGSGIIQVDNMMYNFGPDVMNHLNVPWGGVRPSSVPYTFKSNADGSDSLVTAKFPSQFQMEDCNGWVAWSSSPTGHGPTLAIVFNKEETLGNNLINWGTAGNADRDYFVFAYIVHADDNLSFGEAQQWRYFYVVGDSIPDIKSKIDQYDLSGNTFETNETPFKSSVSEVDYFIEKSDSTLSASYVDAASANFTTKTQPYSDSYPLFFLKSSTGETRITTDLYTFGVFPYLNETSVYDLLGYVDNKINVDVDTIADSLIITLIDQEPVDTTGIRTNLALSGTATQSSTDFGGDPARAIDGDTNGAYAGQSVTHTANEPNPWWQVDLGKEHSIGDIEVYGRTDECCKARLSHFTINVINSNNVVNYSKTYNSYPDPSVLMNAGGAQGKIIQIQLNDTSALSLAEVKVFAFADSATNIDQDKTGFSELNPDKFSLKQNYPNPFNPRTRIYFNLPEAARVKLTVYDIQGCEVRTLLNGYKNVGIHNVEWNATNAQGVRVPTGIYFYRIRVEGKTLNINETRKMILVK